MRIRPSSRVLTALRVIAPIAFLAVSGCNESDLTRPDALGTGAETVAELSKRPSERVVALVISPDTAMLAVGGSRTFSATGRRKDGTTVPLSARWSATGGDITSSGDFSAGNVPGTYRVIAKSSTGSLTDTALVMIVAEGPGDPTLVSIALTPGSATLAPGAAQQFSVTGKRSDGSTVPVTPTYTAGGGAITLAGMYTAGQTAGSFRVIASAPGGAIADTSALTITASPPPSGTYASCLDRGPATSTITGTQTARLDDRTGLAANAIIDARAASWPQVDDYAVLIGGGDGWCWTGGRIEGFWDDQTSWADMHGRTAFEDYGGAHTVVEGLWLKNYGDGWKPRITADDWTLRRSHFIHMRDDCLENDYERGGLVDDVFFEGCYNAFSARPNTDLLGTYSGADKVWTIQNSLVWLEPMAQVYKGTSPNTSGFFKWDKSSYDSSPRLVLRNNVFRADMVPADGNLCLGPPGKLDASVNNVMVWLGQGEYPCFPLPSGWTLTTDRRVWDDAVAVWRERHPDL
jgi:hypothetical protein